MNVQSHIAISVDGVPIHYDVQGNGATALVFVHGWCCDRHYWDRQVSHFPHYTVATLDLAGHGESGRDRTRWTMPAFGQDVVAVVEQLGLEQVVLIGHSMGGAAPACRGHRPGGRGYVERPRAPADPSTSCRVGGAFSHQFRRGDPPHDAGRVRPHVRPQAG